jgi:hypothetical protein
LYLIGTENIFHYKFFEKSISNLVHPVIEILKSEPSISSGNSVSYRVLGGKLLNINNANQSWPTAGIDPINTMISSKEVNFDRKSLYKFPFNLRAKAYFNQPRDYSFPKIKISNGIYPISGKEMEKKSLNSFGVLPIINHTSTMIYKDLFPSNINSIVPSDTSRKLNIHNYLLKDIKFVYDIFLKNVDIKPITKIPSKFDVIGVKSYNSVNSIFRGKNPSFINGIPRQWLASFTKSIAPSTFPVIKGNIHVKGPNEDPFKYMKKIHYVHPEYSKVNEGTWNFIDHPRKRLEYHRHTNREEGLRLSDFYKNTPKKYIAASDVNTRTGINYLQSIVDSKKSMFSIQKMNIHRYLIDNRKHHRNIIFRNILSEPFKAVNSQIHRHEYFVDRYTAHPKIFLGRDSIPYLKFAQVQKDKIKPRGLIGEKSVFIKYLTETPSIIDKQVPYSHSKSKNFGKVLSKSIYYPWNRSSNHTLKFIGKFKHKSELTDNNHIVFTNLFTKNPFFIKKQVPYSYQKSNSFNNRQWKYIRYPSKYLRLRTDKFSEKYYPRYQSKSFGYQNVDTHEAVISERTNSIRNRLHLNIPDSYVKKRNFPNSLNNIPKYIDPMIIKEKISSLNTYKTDVKGRKVLSRNHIFSHNNQQNLSYSSIMPFGALKVIRSHIDDSSTQNVFLTNYFTRKPYIHAAVHYKSKLNKIKGISKHIRPPSLDLKAPTLLI